MRHDVRRHRLGVEFCRRHGIAERAIHARPVAALAVPVERREDPASAIIAHLPLLAQHSGELGSDRLIALPGLGVRNEQAEVVEVKVLPARAQHFAVAHGGIEAEGDKEPAIRVCAGNGCLHQGLALLVRERDDAPLPFPLLPWATRYAVNPLPGDGLAEQVGQGCHLSIDSGGRSLRFGAPLPVAPDRKIADGVEPHGAEERR
jgi:hypothetical protein